MDAHDMSGQMARQDIATAILAPYMTGLVVQVLLIGIFFGLCTTAQRDLALHARTVKVVSWVVFALVVCCLGLACEEIVDTGISQNRSAEQIFAGPPQSNILPILGGLTGAVCQLFLMARAAALMPSRTLRLAFYGVTVPAILLALTGAALFSAMGLLITENKPAPLKYFTAEAIWLWSSAAADLLISLALAHTLHRRIAGFNARTDGILWRLIVVALQTAAYTSIVSIAGAAVATAFEGSSDLHTAAVGFAFWLPLPALHAISLYTTLSSRRAVQHTLSTATTPRGPSLLPLSIARLAGVARGHAASRASATAPLEVKVEREEAVSFDVRDGYDDELDRMEAGKSRRCLASVHKSGSASGGEEDGIEEV